MEGREIGENLSYEQRNIKTRLIAHKREKIAQNRKFRTKQRNRKV